MSDYNIRMRLLRERENLTQKEVAEKLGISPSAYNMYESSRPVKEAEVNYQSVDTFNQEIATAATTAE